MATLGAINYYWQVRQCLVTVRRHRLEHSLAASLEPAATRLRCHLQHYASLTPSACVRSSRWFFSAWARKTNSASEPSSPLGNFSLQLGFFCLLRLQASSPNWLLQSSFFSRRAPESERSEAAGLPAFYTFRGVSGVSVVTGVSGVSGVFGVQIELDPNVELGRP